MSCGGHEPIGDPEDRFEIRFLHDGEEEVFGWASSEAGAQRLVDQVNANPHWARPRIIDRAPAELFV